MGGPIVQRYPNEGLRPGSIYLSCGDSASVDLPDKSVDLIVTDPPFSDNVNYSELADFFFVWQQLYFSTDSFRGATTTRHGSEVQDTQAEAFAKKLKRVFAECHRVLRDDGLQSAPRGAECAPDCGRGTTRPGGTAAADAQRCRSHLARPARPPARWACRSPARGRPVAALRPKDRNYNRKGSLNLPRGWVRSSRVGVGNGSLSSATAQPAARSERRR